MVSHNFGGAVSNGNLNYSEAFLKHIKGNKSARVPADPVELEQRKR